MDNIDEKCVFVELRSLTRIADELDISMVSQSYKLHANSVPSRNSNQSDISTENRKTDFQGMNSPLLEFAEAPVVTKAQDNAFCMDNFGSRADAQRASQLNEMLPVRACVFDVDDLLINTSDLHTRCYNLALSRFGAPPITCDISAHIQGLKALIPVFDAV